MLNHNEDTAQVSQDTLEAILKHAHEGKAPEVIGTILSLDTQTVQWVIANSPIHRERVVNAIKEKSSMYRCALSNRLMIFPVMAPDGSFYEQSILEAHPSISREQNMPSKELKAKIAEFSKESLKVLEGYLLQKDPQEDILQLTAECLSVFGPDAETDSALRVIGAVEGKTVRKLFGKLQGLVTEEMLLSLLSQTARELPSHALCLATLIILEPRRERAFEEAFRCFTELLRSQALGSDAIDLAEEVSERLSSIQLIQMNAALGACPREGGDRLDGLRLKEAYALLREGEVEAAICLVNTLHITPPLEKEVLRFFDQAGLSSGKVPILEQRLSAKLEEISRDSPLLAEAFSNPHQLASAQLHSRKSEAATQQDLNSLWGDVRDLSNDFTQFKQAAQEEMLKRLDGQSQRDIELNSLKTEVLRLNRELYETKHLLQDTRAFLQLDSILPTFIYSFNWSTNELCRTNLVTKDKSSHQVSLYQPKKLCCWSEVPGELQTVSSPRWSS
jgi:hypothetical protein